MDFAAAVRDAILAGVIALGIFGPLVGLKTDQNMQNELVLQTRWGLVAIIVGIVIVGRFLLTTTIWPALAARKLRDKPAPTAAQTARRAAFSR